MIFIKPHPAGAYLDVAYGYFRSLDNYGEVLHAYADGGVTDFCYGYVLGDVSGNFNPAYGDVRDASLVLAGETVSYGIYGLGRLDGFGIRVNPGLLAGGCGGVVPGGDSVLCGDGEGDGTFGEVHGAA